MFDSVRIRVALWHTVVLALVLAAFTIATYGFLRRMTEQQGAHALEQAVSSFGQAFLLERHGDRTATAAAQEAAREFRFSGRRVLVYDRNHQLVAVSDSSADDLTRVISEVDEADDSPLNPLFATLTPGASAHGEVTYDRGRQARAYATRVSVAGEPFTIVAVQTGAGYHSALGTFLRAALVAIPLALLLAGVGGYFLARHSLAPVVHMSRHASGIGSDNLHERLPVRNQDDELGQLGLAFNGLLSRLEEAFGRQRQFIADASHELRTPIASLRAEADVALGRPRSAAEYAASLAHIRAEALRLSNIIDDLFTLARLDAAEDPIRREEIFLEEVVLDAVRSVRPLATRSNISLTYSPDVEARCIGDRVLVHRIVTNLLDNAIKFSHLGGRIVVDISTDGAWHFLRVRDSGPGIPDAARPHVFERFFRSDGARTRRVGTQSGAGLGLAIAHRIAQAHGGRLVLADTGATGTTFELALPAAPPARDPGQPVAHVHAGDSPPPVHADAASHS